MKKVTSKRKKLVSLLLVVTFFVLGIAVFQVAAQTKTIKWRFNIYAPPTYEMSKELVISALVMLGLDATYISFIKDSYLLQIQNIQISKPKVNMIGVLLSYSLMIFGINYFIIQKNASILDAFWFGIVIYGSSTISSGK